jgi:hypothetical protein
MWTYRSNLETTTDLEGFDVVARDGQIGDVDQATYEVGGSWIVVDTGPWIFGRKVVIPASAIERVDLESRNVYVSLSKEQIKGSPEYDPDRFDEGYRTQLGSYYSGTPY